MTDWRAYWGARDTAEHREAGEVFFAKHAREKLMHLGSGDALLDVGCGAADLLVHYAPQFRRVVGVDFSAAMLERARVRVAETAAARHVELHEADDRTVWDVVAGTFDCVTAGGVVQYWDRAQLERFVDQAFSRLAPRGRLVLFEVIDPRIYPLHAMGLFRRDAPSRFAFASQATRWLAWAAKEKLRGRPANPLGHGYRPSDLAALAAARGLELEIAWSMYYEYRYHAVFWRRGS